MKPLVVAVCLLALFSLVHLMVTIAVVRRLREHAILLSRRPTGDPGGPIAAAGTAVGGFSTTGTAGEQVSDDDLTGRTLVGFFSPGCAPCREIMPRFVGSAREIGGERDHVLAVVVGEPVEAAEYAETLALVGRVVVEPPDGPVTTAFGVTGYPAVALVADGTILASGISMDDLAAATVAA